MGLKDISGEQYIRKIIQVEITIGKWKNDSIGDLIGKISEELDDKYKQVITKNKELIEQVVESNPRQAKRFVNNLIVALAANRHLDDYTFLVVEALEKRWKHFYNNLSNATFLKEIKSAVGKSRDQKLEYVSELERKKDKSELSYDLLDVFDDLKYCYVDDELWSFLEKFGTSILSEFSPAEQPKTEQEVIVAKKFEDYQHASESSSIPVSTPNEVNEYARSYYYEIMEKSERYRWQIQRVVDAISEQRAGIDVKGRGYREFSHLYSSIRQFALRYILRTDPKFTEEPLREKFDELLKTLKSDEPLPELYSTDALKGLEKSLIEFYVLAKKAIEDPRLV